MCHPLDGKNRTILKLLKKHRNIACEEIGIKNNYKNITNPLSLRSNKGRGKEKKREGRKERKREGD